MHTLQPVSDGSTRRARRTPGPLSTAPQRFTYEAVILSRNPRLALLLDGTLEGEVRR